MSTYFAHISAAGPIRYGQDPARSAFSKRSTSSCRSGKHHAAPMTRTG